MYRIGVDLGGTNIVAGVVDEFYKIISKGKRKTNCPRPAGEIFGGYCRLCTGSCRKGGHYYGAG